MISIKPPFVRLEINQKEVIWNECLAKVLIKELFSLISVFCLLYVLMKFRDHKIKF